ncbi:non-ribosomal peptide synthetase [Brevibacillus laterosporus]|uniref:non-ribosomal peptide synthetase n=1 Tax=Brevibacillus laterosporus TaxID=1465 RepID=UPI000689E5F8|nr:non-ribosomal peptide synthetase [Brevibacillus laterosporus]
MNDISNKYLLDSNEVQRNGEVYIGSDPFRYQELIREASHLASLLTLHDLNNRTVGIWFEKPNENMILSVIAILQSGVSYTIIDEEFMAENISYIREKYNISLLLTDLKFSEEYEMILDYSRNQGEAIHLVQLPDMSQTCRDTKNTSFVDIQSSKKYLRALYNHFYLPENKKIFIQMEQFHPHTIVELILFGMKVDADVIIDNIHYLQTAAKDEVVGFFHSTFWESLNDEIRGTHCKAMSCIVICGHLPQFSSELKAKVGHAWLPEGTSRIISYNPSVSVGELDGHKNMISIGEPLLPECIYIFDHRLRKVPIGVKGSLYLSFDSIGLVTQESLHESWIEVRDTFLCNIKGSFIRTTKGTLNMQCDMETEPKTPPDIIEIYSDIERTLLDICKKVLRTNLTLNDNIFELGCTSIKAIHLLSRINKEFKLSLELPVIFIHPTLRELAKHISSSTNSMFKTIFPTEKKEYYDLSYSQKSLWIMSQQDKSSIAYNEFFGFEICGVINLDAFKKAIEALVTRHEILRTIFVTVEGEPRQRIYDEIPLERIFFYKDISQVPNSMQYVMDTINKEKMMPFDLQRGPLLSIKLYKLEEAQFILTVGNHHIISDAWSDSVMFQEIIMLYHTFNDENENTMVPLEIQYKDYAEWQNQQLREGRFEEHKRYWMEQFQDDIPVLQLPTWKERPETLTFRGKTIKLKVEEDVRKGLYKLTEQNQTTLLVTVLSVLNLLFYKYSNQNDIVLGTTFADRIQYELQGQIGLYINTVPIRTQFTPNDGFHVLMSNVKNVTYHALQHRLYPFDLLVDDLQLKTNKNRSPLFDVLVEVLNENNLIENWVGKRAELEIKPLPIEDETSLMDMNIFFSEQGDELYIIIQYNSDVYEEKQIEFLVGHFEKIVRLAENNPNVPIKNYSILLDAEQDLLAVFHQNNKPFPQDKTLPLLIEEQAKLTPDKVAIYYQGESITYGELVEKANQIAYLLRDKDISRDQVVGILMDRSTLMVESILGVWKAGAAYLPLDSQQPIERMKYIVENSQVSFLIFEKKYSKEANQLQWECSQTTHIFCIDSEDVFDEDESIKETQSKSIWKYVTEKAQDDIEEGMWINSYTGHPFTQEEMNEYKENIFSKLSPYLNKETKVLEIGCSSGFSMYRIAPFVKHYVGIDMTEFIIEKNRKIIQEKGINNIELACMYAHEIDKLQPESFDIVIINSVVQFFSGHNYLRKVIQKIVEIAKSEAIIFFGDLLDQRKKTNFLHSLQEFKKLNLNKDYKTWTDWSDYLFVCPEFFEDLVYDFPEIDKIEHSKKIYTIENELTKFRFDTIVKINKKEVKKLPLKRYKHQYDATYLNQYSHRESICEAQPNDLCYIIYTSGSTGKPKGVMVEHIGMLNHIFAKINDLHLNETSIIVQNANQCFDISVWQFFSGLVVGGKVCIYSQDLITNLQKIIEQVEQDCVTILEVVPSYLISLLDVLEELKLQNAFTTLRYLLVTGEELKANLANRWLQFFPSIPLVNAYGPTEASDDITHHFINEAINETHVPIGKPVQNFTIYIVDEHMNVNPLGVIGEICVAGMGVGRGYLYDEERTKKAFLNNPFNVQCNERFYRTGDLGRWRIDGTIDYFGRIDHQVKIRGFRIEIGEIIKKLSSHEKIKEVEVIDITEPNGTKALYAYYVEKENIEMLELKQYLSALLPEYMIPSYFISIEKFPLTPNGKIDRKVLARIGKEQQDGLFYIAPQNSIEEQLVSIWKEVLYDEKIGVTDDFFYLGGHSLKATNIISKIYKKFQVDFPLSEIFKNPTIRQMAQYIQTLKRKKYEEILPIQEQAYYLASSSQKRIFLLNQLDKINLSYNIPYALQIDGYLDQEKVKRCFETLIDRHESLRTSFEIKDGQVVQIIHKTNSFEITCYQIKDFDQESIDEIIDKFVQPFDLGQTSLLRVGIVTISEDKNILLFDMHHIISDGLSMLNLVKEFCHLYNGQELSPLTIQYKDYSDFQQRMLQSEDLMKQKAYWLSVFEKGIPTLNMALDFPRQKKQSFEGDTVSFTIDIKLTKQLKEIAVNNSATLYMVMLSAFNVLLSKYTGQDDIVIGSPIAGRQHPDLENIIGVFINLLCIRNFPVGEKTFNEFLQDVKVNTIQAYENQTYPFEELVNQLDVPRDVSRNPIFDVMFVLQNMEDQKVEMDQLSVTPYEIKNNTAQFDLKLEAVEKGEEILCQLEYCTKLYKTETIQRMARHFITILEQIATHPETKLSQINMLTEEDRRTILQSYETNISYSLNKTIHRLFEEKAELYPNETVLFFKDQYMTYKELNNRANQVSHLLKDIGIQTNDRVAIYLDRGIEMIVGILGALKAGAAYVPLDPSYPADRVHYIVDHAECRVLLTGGKLFEELLSDGVEHSIQAVINLTDENLSEIMFSRGIAYYRKTEIEAYSTQNLYVPDDLDRLMYIMYTSGSTGLPKGVMVTHKNVTNFISWSIERFNLEPSDRMMLVTSISFDISVFEMFGAMISGATLYILDQKTISDPRLLLSYIEKNRITVWHSVPTLMNQLLLTLRGQNKGNASLSCLNDVRLVLLGGEQWSIKLAKEIRQTFSHAKIVNLYGPTEATIWISSFSITDVDGNFNKIPIGKPITNNRLIILNENLQECPIGIPGHIYISGINVTKGYFKDQEKTNQSFILDQKTQEILYKTGDMGRYLPDGNVDFLGRKDGMVKVNGYRIEVEEIEQVLLEKEEIHQVAIIAKKDAETNYLVCYYSSEKEWKHADLVAYLKRRLPAYMIPTIFIPLKEMPLTPNGKINRRALVNNDITNLTGGKDTEHGTLDRNNAKEDTSKLVDKITAIWQNVLGVEQISVDDDFFAIGGNSLLAVQLDLALEKEHILSDDLIVYEHRTINELASFIENSNQAI